MAILDLETQKQGEAVVVALSGELDLSSAERVETELARVETDAPALILLDLSRLKFLDSTGLRLIVTADQRARQADRRFVVVKGPDTVHRVFTITKLDDRLEIVDDASELTAS